MVVVWLWWKTESCWRSSVILDYYSLVKLTASQMVHMTQEVGHKSNQLQTLLKIFEQQLGQDKRKLLLLTAIYMTYQQ